MYSVGLISKVILEVTPLGFFLGIFKGRKEFLTSGIHSAAGKEFSSYEGDN